MITKDPTPFSKDEYQRRIGNVIDAMTQRGVDTLVVNDAADMIYLTGYLGDSDYVPQCFILTSGGDMGVYLRDQDVGGAMHTSWLPDEAIVGYPEDLIGNAERDGYDFIIDKIPTSGRVGLAWKDMSWDVANRFVKAIGEDRLVDTAGLVAWLRLVKSPAEVQVVREASQIASLAAMKAGEVIRSGVRECDAAAEITAAAIRGSADFGGHFVFAPLMAPGTKTGTPHLPWTDQPFAKGSSVNLEVGGTRYGYFGAIMRTLSIGKPSAGLQSLHDATVGGFEKALAAARPGALAEDIAHAFLSVIEPAGYSKASRCGYPMGIHWLEPTVSLRDGDKTVLKPGMTFHFMLGMWVERDFGCTYSETVAITDTGAEVLTNAPRAIMEVE
ncbi:MAG: Xaa-Pro peptidase family protein [Pseudomonadota bacterium]